MQEAKTQESMCGMLITELYGVSEESGGVSVVDENGLLSQVHETTGIEMREDGQIQCDNKEVQE